MARKKKKSEDNLDTDNGLEEEKGGGIAGALLAVAIIVIWLVIFALLIKMDVGGVGSMLRPFLKNVPVINRILPDKSDEEVMEETGYKYKNLAEAVDRIKELEDQLAQYQNNGAADSDQIAQLKAEVERLKVYEDNQENFLKQKEEFESFHGPILMTTNCIVPPKGSYKDRLYTTGAAGYPGCKHISGEIGEEKDFSAIIEQAKHCAPPEEIERGEIIGGFAHNQVLALADDIVTAVKSGAIRKFVVMAGCDGRMKSRNYYTDFAKALPKDTVILTAGCAKYKYNKLNLGDIGGIPRVLDAGQCNDSYSLAVIALKLKEVFGLEDINELPIIYNISWYEQKAVIVLLALLYLGVKNIHLGPTLPAFLSPNVAKVLVDNFGIAGIGSVEKDLKLFGLSE